MLKIAYSLSFKRCEAVDGRACSLGSILQHSLKIRVSDVCFTIVIVYVDIIAMIVIALLAFLWP